MSCGSGQAAGPVSQATRSNTGVQDALLFDQSLSAFNYEAPKTISNFVIEETDVFPLNQSNQFGTQMKWEFSKDADLLGPLEMVMQLAPLDQTGGARYWVDNFGIQALREVRLTYASNQLTEIPREWLRVRYRKYLNTETENAWARPSMQDQTTADRQAFGISGGEVIVSLAVPWGDDTAQFISMVALANKISLTVRFEDLEHLLVHDADNLPLLAAGQTPVLSDVHVHAYQVHLTGAERNKVISHVKNPNGLAKLVEDIQIHRQETVPENSSSVRIDLTNITAPVRSLFFYFVDPRDIAGALGPNAAGGNGIGGDRPFNVINPGVCNWRVISGSNTIVPWTSDLRSRWVNHGRWWSSRHAGEAIYSYAYSVTPETPNANYGSLNYGQMNTPRLEINFDGPITTDGGNGLYLYIIADTLNFYHEQGGDLTKTFH